ncbi:hypothetical protein B0J17DRAFT_634215 [Rhizoctonia solani]|nr:hypothetical protein B0J17DRAFT_634215 [Rhizoctonia solani]
MKYGDIKSFQTKYLGPQTMPGMPDPYSMQDSSSLLLPISNPPQSDSSYLFGASQHTHSSISLPTTGGTLLQIPVIINPTLFRTGLKHFYVGRGVELALELLSDVSTKANLAANSEPMVAVEQYEKLQKDMIYMWMTPLHSNIQDICSKNPLSLDLPTPPFTSASLYFTLGFIYTGTLAFFNCTWDLETAFNIMQCAKYLGLDTLKIEMEDAQGVVLEHGAGHALVGCQIPDGTPQCYSTFASNPCWTL